MANLPQRGGLTGRKNKLDSARNFQINEIEDQILQNEVTTVAAPNSAYNSNLPEIAQI
jgi:hypothetical protein